MGITAAAAAVLVGLGGCRLWGLVGWGLGLVGRRGWEVWVRRRGCMLIRIIIGMEGRGSERGIGRGKERERGREKGRGNENAIGTVWIG